MKIAEGSSPHVVARDSIMSVGAAGVIQLSLSEAGGSL
jgi:hypothetical protein